MPRAKAPLNPPSIHAFLVHLSTEIGRPPKRPPARRENRSPINMPAFGRNHVGPFWSPPASQQVTLGCSPSIQSPPSRPPGRGRGATAHRGWEGACLANRSASEWRCPAQAPGWKELGMWHVAWPPHAIAFRRALLAWQRKFYLFVGFAHSRGATIDLEGPVWRLQSTSRQSTSGGLAKGVDFDLRKKEMIPGPVTSLHRKSVQRTPGWCDHA